MKVIDYLNSKNVEFTETQSSNGNQARMECPSCGDQKSFSISLETGVYNCFRKNKCGIKGSFSEFQKMFGDKPVYLDNDRFIKLPKKYSTPNVQVEPINSKVISYLGKRGIKQETVKRFGLGYLNNAIVFQYHKKGKLVNIKYRSISEKKFWKEKDCQSILWAQDLIQGEKLIICEGEIDAMSFWEYGIQAVSIPSGVSDMGWIEADWNYLEKLKTIYIVMDNDTAGQNAVSTMVKRLGSWRCKNVILPFKDVNECLMKGVSKDKIHLCFKNAGNYDPSELKNCANFSEEIISYKNNAHLLNGIPTGSEGLTDILKGWRDEEVSIWTGINSSGKSTFLSQEVLHLVGKGKKVCVGSFEMHPKKYLWWLLKQRNGSDIISDNEVKKSLEELAKNLFVIDFLGDIKENRLFEIMEFAFRKYGINVFVIDSLMKIDLTTDNRKFYGEQKRFVSRLKDFAVSFKSHVHLIAHPRKTSNTDVQVGKMDISGSADITNLADNVFILHRYSEDVKELRAKEGKEKLDNLLIVEKNREHGTIGKVGFRFNIESKIFSYVPLTDYQKKKYERIKMFNGKESVQNNWYNREENVIEEYPI